LPVFDVTTQLNYAYNAIVSERFTGFGRAQNTPE